MTDLTHFSTFSGVGWLDLGLERADDDQLLPPGLDSHRYRVIGNGVAEPVAEWIGRRLAAELSAEERTE
jgi:site-specific DNA-cytosine methylase